MNPTDSVTLTLSCGHPHTTSVAEMMRRSTFVCFACKNPRAWVKFDAMGKGWWFWCKNCRYKRAFGEAGFTCRTKAASHAVRKRHNLTTVYVDTRQQYVVAVDSPLPSNNDDPPF